MRSERQPDLVERWTLEGGLGLLDVVGGDFDSALTLRGAAVALRWADCEGSVAQYLLRAGDTVEVGGRLAAIRRVVEGGLDPEVGLVAQLYPLLELFTDGTYELGLRRAPVDSLTVVAADACRRRLSPRDHFYPFGICLITTRPEASFSAGRVEHFAARIASGERPLVCTAGIPGGPADFVVDGHHKLRAYEQAHVAPALVTVTRLDPRPITPEDAARFATGTIASYRASYLRLKAVYDPPA